MRIKSVLWTLLPGVLGCAVAPAHSQPFPSKPIRIVTSSPGGGPDFVARIVAQGMTDALPHPTIIDNRTSGVIPGQVVSQAAPDGYTVLLYANSFWIGPLMQKTPYDVIRDFAPITLASKAPNILMVHPSLPVRSVKELIALARAHPNELNFTAGGIGGASHLSGELFKSMAKINIAIIPYKSGSQETADLIGGHVQATFGSAGQFSPHIKAGKLRALAVTSAQPSALFPEYPTMAASGMPGYEYINVTGMFAPAKTPEALIARLNQEAVRALTRPDAKERLAASGIEPAPSTPEAFAASIKSDMAKYGKLIKEAGIRAD